MSACRPDERAPLQVPPAYNDVDFFVNATHELGVLDQFQAMMDEAKKGRSTERKVALEVLNAHFTAGTPSLRDYSTGYYANRMQGVNGWLETMAKAGGNLWRPGMVSETGGFYAGYLFTSSGLELEQVIEKGLYAAALYNRFLNLAKGNITPETVDQMLAIYGASPEFANSYQSRLHANPDRVSAAFAACRDKNDEQGLYTQIRDNFIKLQAAVQAGSDYNKDRDAAIIAIKELWEKAHFATVVYYSQEALSLLKKNGLSDAERARVLHDLSACVGSVHGWKILPDKHKKIAEHVIDNMLRQLRAPADAPCTISVYLEDPPHEMQNLHEIIKTIEDIYDFTPSEIQDFSVNWVAKQNR